MNNKLNKILSTILIVLAIINIIGSIIFFFDITNYKNNTFELITSILYFISKAGIIAPYIIVALFIVYIVILLISSFNNQLKGIFIFKYFSINLVCLLIAIIGAILYLYKIASGVSQIL